MQNSAVIILSLACLGDFRKINMDNFKMELSKKHPRVGDRFNVTFTVTSTDDLPENCKTIDQVYMQSSTDANLPVHRLNSTALYHEGSSAVSAAAYSYDSMCGGQSLAGIKTMIGARFENIGVNCTCWYNDKTVCTFRKPQFHNKDDYYKANFSLQHEETRIDCSNTSKSEIQECIIEFGPKEDFVIWLRMIDDGGEQGPLNFTFDYDECVMMNTPTNGVYLNSTSDSICLELTDNSLSEYTDLTAIKWLVSLTDHNHTFHSHNNSVEYRNNRVNFCVRQLPRPHHNYTLDFKRRYSSKARWSASFVHSGSTDAALPPRPPMVWPGGYHLNLNSSILCVYWQQLDELQHNGENFTYNVSVHNNNRSLIKHVKIEVRPNMAIISNFHMISGSYRIIIRSQNEIGVSENSSEIVVEMSPESYKLIPKNAIFSRGEKKFIWEQPERTDQLQSYRVYWCKRNEQNLTECNETLPMMSEQVVHTQRYFKKKYADDDSYMWAVSANYGTDNGSGGMRWMSPFDISTDKSNVDGAINNELFIALVGVGVLMYGVIRRYRLMSNIGVDLPEGLVRERELKRAEQQCPEEAPEETTKLVNAPEIALELLAGFRPHDDFTAPTPLTVDTGYLEMDPRQVNAESKFLTSQGRTIPASGYCSITQILSNCK